MKQRLGLLSIGESPRPDVMAAMRREMPDTDIIEHGILDGLTTEQRNAVAPEGNEEALVSRLRDGSQFKLSHRKVTALLGEGLSHLAQQGASISVLLCTSRFNVQRPSGMILVEAGKIIDSTIASLSFPGGTMGILAPLQEQAEHMREVYADLGMRMLTAAASPYGDVSAASKAAVSLKGADFIILHCMGYTAPFKKAVSDVCGCPVIQSNSIVARYTAELLSEV